MPISWVKDRPRRLFLIFGVWFGKRMSHASWCWRKLSILQKSCVFNIGQRRKIKMSVMANYPNIRYTSESWRKKNWQTSTFEPLDYTRCTTMYVLSIFNDYLFKRNRKLSFIIFPFTQPHSQFNYRWKRRREFYCNFTTPSGHHIGECSFY